MHRGLLYRPKGNVVQTEENVVQTEQTQRNVVHR